MSRPGAGVLCLSFPHTLDSQEGNEREVLYFQGARSAPSCVLRVASPRRRVRHSNGSAHALEGAGFSKAQAAPKNTAILFRPAFGAELA